jgi:hypothetical protein
MWMKNNLYVYIIGFKIKKMEKILGVKESLKYSLREILKIIYIFKCNMINKILQVINKKSLFFNRIRIY